MDLLDIMLSILKKRDNYILDISAIEENTKTIDLLLKEVYQNTSSISISNDSYQFVHENIINKVKIDIKIFKQIIEQSINKKEVLKCIIQKEKINLLEDCFIKYINDLKVHYCVMLKLIDEYPNEKQKIKNEIKRLLNTIDSCKKQLKLIDNMKEKYKSIVEILLKDNDYKEANNYYKNILREGNIPYIDIEIKKYDYLFRSIAQVELDLENYFSNEDNQNEYMSKIIEIEDKIINNKKLPYVEYRNIENSIFIIEKFTNIDTKIIKEKYKEIIKFKYKSLKDNLEIVTNQNIEEINIKDEIFFSFYIEEKINNTNSKINNKIFKYLDKYQNNILKDFFLRTLFFYTINNNLLEWFEIKINIKNYLKDKYTELKNNCNIKNISFKETVSIETFLYLISEISVEYKDLLEVHKSIIEQYGPTKFFLEGIESISFHSESMKDLLDVVLSKKKDIRISGDIKTFILNNSYRDSSSNLIFQDGTENISIENVHFENPVSITIPSTVKSLSIEITNSNIRRIIFENYKNSQLFDDDNYLRNLLELFYSNDNICNYLEIIGKSTDKIVSYKLSKKEQENYFKEYYTNLYGFYTNYMQYENKAPINDFIESELKNIKKEFNINNSKKKTI